MSPLGRVPSLPDRGRLSEEVGDTQAGRSQSQLGAERDTAAIRSQSSNESMARPSIPEGSPDTSELERRIATLQSSRQRMPHIPARPSPLNSASNSSLDSSNPQAAAEKHASPAGESSSEEVDGGQITTSVSTESGRKSELGSSGELPRKSLRRELGAAVHSGANGRRELPKTLKDLGRDYSRYPSSSNTSRATSRPSSQRPLLASAGTSSPLLRTTTENPFSDSEADLEKWGYPDDSIGAFDPYYGGEKGFILYSDEVEGDDTMHLPADDDDVVFKPRFSEYLEPRSLISAVGGIFLILGLLCVFVLFPALTFTTRIFLPSGGGHSGGGGGRGGPINYGPAWAHVNNRTYPLLQNVRTGLIDGDTPQSAYTRKSTFDDSVLNLVFSDEFNVPNRTFYAGDDPFWTAPDIWYGATQDMEWYDPDAVTTGNGTLQLKMDAFINHGLQYRSGMLNSWNQLCFKGGVFEISVSLAGPSGIPGLWPGAWSMGNLGRPGYKATTEGVWPYTYNECDAGITVNQSSPDGLSHLPGQKLTACSCKGADHPNPGTGRGAPEIDILEGSVDPTNRIGVVTQSFQVAPFDVWYRPNSDFLQIPNYETTQMNGYCGGPFQQAISGTTLLNNNWYDGEEYQKYAFEYIPGTDEGKIAWFVGEDQTFMMDGRAIGANGNVGPRVVSEEPMSIVLNLGMSGSWSEIIIPELKFPTVMHIDYVRIYQKEGEEMITCDPPGYPTTEYIANHPKAYMNPNLTEWDQTGYGWPKNKLTGC